ncbi:MAG: ABC transporter ATP-binding protein/permease [Ancrocorticia sp.]|jgi:ABC-type transport system involved in cytochrome bd biosynthesis fused ATPase/permease subunit|nr:ABC transporter ATP-binding protein/permease [Ancrocorticia sp.]
MNQSTPNLHGLLTWLTGITHPVHKPLLVSTFFRFINLTLDIVLFGLAGGGVAAIITGTTAWPVFLWLVIVALVKASAYYLEQLTGHYVAFKALELLRTEVFSSLWPKAPAIVTHAKSGDILASLTRDVDRIEVVYAHTFAPVVSAFVVPLAVIVATGATVGWGTVLVPALCVALSLLAVPFIGFRSSMRATRQTLQLRRALSHHISDSVFGTEEVVGYGREADRLAQMDQLSDKVSASSLPPKRANAARRSANAMLMLFSLIGITAVNVAAGHSLVITAALAAGSLRLFEGPRGVEDAVGYLDYSLAAAHRLWEISHAPAAVSDGPAVYTNSKPPTITFEDVSYSYAAGGQDATNAPFALSHLSFTVPAGTRTVLVGPSGSGKSTTLQLLLRYDDPGSGRILLDGVDIREFTLDSLRHAVVVVSQKNQLLDTSIRDNVTLGAPAATDAQIAAALRAVHLDQEIAAMPQGLDTPVGMNGSGLSGGQVQRLCVARALLMEPKVLVLDEFTANLNPALEKSIRTDIAAALPDVTIVEVTHRIESAMDADAVIELEHGHEVAHGVPREILANYV